MFTLIKDFTNWLDGMESAIWFFYSSHWLAMANCTINPFIYGYSNKNFRVSVFNSLCWQFIYKYSKISLLGKMAPNCK
jgi:hypothetical protein